MLGTRHCFLYTTIMISKYLFVSLRYEFWCPIYFVLLKRNPGIRGSGGFYVSHVGCVERVLCYCMLSFKPLYFWVSPFLLIAYISNTNILLLRLFNSKNSKGETVKIFVGSVLSRRLQGPHGCQFETFYVPSITTWESSEQWQNSKKYCTFSA